MNNKLEKIKEVLQTRRVQVESKEEFIKLGKFLNSLGFCFYSNLSPKRYSELYYPEIWPKQTGIIISRVLDNSFLGTWSQSGLRENSMSFQEFMGEFNKEESKTMKEKIEKIGEKFEVKCESNSELLLFLHFLVANGGQIHRNEISPEEYVGRFSEYNTINFKNMDYIVGDYMADNPISIEEFFQKLSAPEVSLPIINGYKGQFDKDSNVVIYGCAKLPVRMLNAMNDAAKDFGGNRTVAKFELSSGVVLTQDQIEQILEFVDSF